jgi:hypothetical protein
MNNGFNSNWKNVVYALKQGRYPGLSNLGNLFAVATHAPAAPPWPPVEGKVWPPTNYNPLAQSPDRILTPKPNALNFPGYGKDASEGMYPYQPYQVSTGDTFESIAAKTGQTVQQLQEANGMTVPPPNGSFINIPQPAPIANYYPASSMGGYQQMNELNAQIQKQIAAGQLPQTVSALTPIINPSTGQAATPAEMEANGYKWDFRTNSWNLAGQSSGSSSPGNDNPRTVYYSKARGMVTPEVARLLNKKRRRRQQDRPRPEQQPSNGSISTSLNTHIEGG